MTRAGWAMYGMGGMNMPADETLVLNANNNVVKLLLDLKDKEDKKDDTKLICRQIYDLAVMSHRPLTNEEMTEFISRSNKILNIMAQ